MNWYNHYYLFIYQFMYFSQELSMWFRGCLPRCSFARKVCSFVVIFKHPQTRKSQKGQRCVCQKMDNEPSNVVSSTLISGSNVFASTLMLQAVRDKTLIQAIRKEFPHPSTAIQQKIRLDCESHATHLQHILVRRSFLVFVCRSCGSGKRSVQKMVASVPYSRSLNVPPKSVLPKNVSPMGPWVADLE